MSEKKSNSPALNQRSVPWCCQMDCTKDAEFAIYGSSGHPDDVTETCAEHVGSLLGTPTWLKEENTHWLVYPLEVTHQGGRE